MFLRLRYPQRRMAQSAAILAGLAAVCHGQSGDALLERAEAALAAGNYRSTARLLEEMARENLAETAGQQRRLADLQAEVDFLSGRLEKAARIATQHLNQLDLGTTSRSLAGRRARRAALARLGRIQLARALAEPPNRAAPLLADAQRRFHAALELFANEANHAVERGEVLRDSLAVARALQDETTIQQRTRQLRHHLVSALVARARAQSADQVKADDILRLIDIGLTSFTREDVLALQAPLEELAQRPFWEPSEEINLRERRAAVQRLAENGGAERAALIELLKASRTVRPRPLRIEARALLRLGELADQREDRTAATQHYRSAAVRLQKLVAPNSHPTDQPDADADQPGDRIAPLQQLELIYTRLADWPKAIVVVESLLQLRDELLVEDDPTLYRTISALGALHAKAARDGVQNRDYLQVVQHAQRAETYLQRAARFWQTHRPLARRDLAATLNNWAEVARYNGDFHQAANLLDQAEPIVQRAYDKTDVPLAGFLLNRAAVDAAVGRFTTAERSYRRAISVCEQGADNPRQRMQVLAAAHLNLAQLYKSQRQYADAARSCRAALQLAESLFAEQQFAQAPFLIVAASLALAEADEKLAAPRRGPGKRAVGATPAELLQQAESDVQRALAALGGDNASPSMILAVARHMQATLLYRKAQLANDPQLDEQAAKIWQQLADYPELPGIQTVKIRAVTALVELDLRSTAKLRRQARDEQDVDERSKELLRLSNVALDSALNHSLQAVRLADQVTAYPAVRFLAQLRRAQVLDAQAQRLAASPARQASEQAAVDEAAKRSRQQAIELLEVALDEVELPRSMTVGAESERAEYFAQFAAGFDLLVDLYVHTGQLEDALRVSERRRSRTYLDQVRASGVDLRAELPDLAAQERNILQAYNDQLQAARRMGLADGDEHELQTARNRLEELKRQWTAIRREIVNRSSIYRRLRSDSDDGATNYAAALEHDEMALVYHLGLQNSYAFLVSPAQPPQKYPLVVNRQAAQMLGLRAGMLTGPAAAEIVNWAMTAVAPEVMSAARGGAATATRSLKLELSNSLQQQFCELLVPAPAREEIERQHAAGNLRRLIVVPDGALHQLPLGALIVNAEPEVTYLIDRLPPLAYAPSLAIYGQLKASTGPGDGSLSLLTVGDPVYESSATTAADALERSVGGEFQSLLGVTLQQLPSTRRECHAVREAFADLSTAGQGNVLQLLGGRATETGVKQEIAGKRIVHLAAHGLVDQSYSNLFGAIALSASEEDDGFLSLYEIYRLPLADCELAILSACQTNCGPRRPMEAGSTMARAFLCGGARRVVSSHWNVPDAPTAQLVSTFARTLADDAVAGRPIDYARALRTAQLQLRNNPATSHPRNWAPLVLVGPGT